VARLGALEVPRLRRFGSGRNGRRLWGTTVLYCVHSNEAADSGRFAFRCVRELQTLRLDEPLESSTPYDLYGLYGVLVFFACHSSRSVGGAGRTEREASLTTGT